MKKKNTKKPVEMGNIPRDCYMSAAASMLAAGSAVERWVFLDLGRERAISFDLRFGREADEHV